MNRALRVREEKSKIPAYAPISRKEYIAMITDRPLCIWGECYPVSQEEQKGQKKKNYRKDKPWDGDHIDHWKIEVFIICYILILLGMER